MVITIIKKNRKTDREFGNLFQLYSIFIKATGLELPSDLSSKFGKEPDSWREYYKQKTGSVNERDYTILRKQCDKEYYIAQENMKKFQDDVNYSTVIEMASKMLWILDLFPIYSGCYLILGSILYKMGRPEDALSVLEMGRMVDPTFEPFSGRRNKKNVDQNMC
ncbi:hypothetical protein K501DRAFT_175640 [Backusella circina FSU 941]|nr:hypothetical protein K501DRAFT_175640 [Backusella circina FSU 941]